MKVVRLAMLLLPFFICAWMLVPPSADAQTCAAPAVPWLTSAPDVLVLLSNTPSMTCRAYASQAFNPGVAYWGYFDSQEWYVYSTAATEFVDAGPKSGGRPPNSWDGNFLNWMTHRRVDVMRKALLGGKLSNGSFRPPEGHSGTGVPGICTGDTDFNSHLASAEDYTPYVPSGAMENGTTTGMLIANNSVTNTLIPGFTTPGSQCTSANISWALGGTTNLTTCTAIDLIAPDNLSILPLKAAGASNTGFADVTGFYQLHGIGNYKIRLSELTNCHRTGPANTATLNNVSMAVTGTGQTVCFHFHDGNDFNGSGFSVDPISTAVCPTSGTPGVDEYSANISNPTLEDGIVRYYAGRIRWGFMFYGPDRGGDMNGNCTPVDDLDAQTPNCFSYEILNKETVLHAPTAESLWSAIGYYAQDGTTDYDTGPRYDNSSYPTNCNSDPFCNFGTSGACISFIATTHAYVLLITDGEPTTDNHFPWEIQNVSAGYAGDASSPGPTCTITHTDGLSTLDDAVSDCALDNVALYGNVQPGVGLRDLRSSCLSNVLGGAQNVQTFILYTFGTGSETMKIAARNGGFGDLNGNFVPDLHSEWDADADGIPDNYFEALNGGQVVSALQIAIDLILGRSGYL